NAQTMIPQGLENKALDYFCNNISKIKPELARSNIKFTGYTFARASNVFEIANCLRDIKLIKDSIPNVELLDSLKELNAKRQFQEVKIEAKCSFLKKRIFA